MNKLHSNRCLLSLGFIFSTITFMNIGWAQENSSAAHTIPKMDTTGSELIGGDFTLSDHNGKKISSQDYRGQYLLIFFGFSKCPTACPVGLGAIMEALEKLGPLAKEIQPFFISVDPERDTQAVLKTFVEAYGPPLIGLRGNFLEIEKVAKKYRAYYQKIPDPTQHKKSSHHQGNMNYLMDHSTTIYLMGKDGKYLAHFPSEEGAELLAEKIKKYLQ